MSRTSYLRRPLTALLIGAALAASVVMAAVVLASPAWAATYTVNTNADSGPGSLRQAIIDANANAGEDTINFDLGPSATITLASSQSSPYGQLPTITEGAGLIIDGGSADITISGANQVRVFWVDSGAKLTLSNLTVTNGADAGGGIYNAGTLEVSNSTLSGNSAEDNGGGAIYNYIGTLEVSNSTFNGNSSLYYGGAISNISGTATLKNTIVANSPSVREGGNCFGSIITNGGYNLDSGTSCGFGTANNSLSSTDPMLGVLADNGGPTKSHALLEGSPAIGKGNNAFAVDANGNALQFDQRGANFARIVGASVDIGAFEVQSLPDTAAPRVTSTVPGSNIGGVAPTINVKATFSEHDPGEEGMMASSITGQTFKLFKKGSTTKIGAAVSYSASTDTATLNPTNNLKRGVTYNAVVTTEAKDLAGNRLDQNSSLGGLQQKAWTFTIRN